MPRTARRTRTVPRDGSHVRTNRRDWDRTAGWYERRHRRTLSGRSALAWGLWRRTESSLELLGGVRRRDVLELGCGAARWAAGLSSRGARVVGLDVSANRLKQAKEVLRRARRPVPLVRADAERLPFRDRSFDIVFCDYGAMTFCDPDRTVPEASRVLRPGGRLVFATASPLRYLTYDRNTDRQSRTLVRDYFGLGRVAVGSSVEFQRTFGEWFDLFRRHGFRVERLVEPHPGPSDRSTYLSAADDRWAARWPAEAIWGLRRVGRSD